MHKELDKFVETDEKVRTDLDRKIRVDYLKSKNQEELQQSFVKAKLRSSPRKNEPSATMYQSPYDKKK